MRIKACPLHSDAVRGAQRKTYLAQPSAMPKDRHPTMTSNKNCDHDFYTQEQHLTTAVLYIFFERRADLHMDLTDMTRDSLHGKPTWRAGGAASFFVQR